jgi:protein-disulfide isomerase
LIEPPVPPVIKIENLLIHFRGNTKSKVTFLIISDFECEMCRKFNPIFDSLYFKYKDKVRFGFTNFGSYATLSSITVECAAKQGKFWEMHDLLFSTPALPDTTDILNMAYDCNLNVDEFTKDLNDQVMKTAIERNIKLLINAGIYGTPTIMINNKPIFNSSSIAEIEQRLLKELSNSN